MIQSAPLALAFILATLFSLLLLVGAREGRSTYLSDTEAHATHVLMNGVMAVMFAPFYSMDLESWLLAALGLGVVILLIRLAVGLHGKRGSAPGTVYHLFAAAAMIGAILMVPHHSAMEAMAIPAHPPGWPAMLLGAIFALDAVITAIMAFAFPRRLIAMAAEIGAGDAGSAPASVRILQLSALPHVAMDIGMVLMLV